MDINYTFKNIALRDAALTHPSMAKTQGVVTYERLEFLGDNVISMLVSEELFARFPDASEGELSRLHSNLVRTNTLAEIAKSINLGDDMILDKGEEANGGRENLRNLEDALEAMVAAVYLDSGCDLPLVKSLFLNLWEDHIKNPHFVLRDAKSSLQEWAQKSKYGIPVYQVIKEEGLAHQKVFTVQLRVADFAPVESQASSIKKAESEAAKQFIQINKINETE